MYLIPRIMFIVLLAGAVYLFAGNISRIRRVILLGKDEDIETDKATRLKNLVLLALGQKKMFRNPLVAFLHLLVYVGFIIINIEVLEILLDGIFGTHRLFAPLLGNSYTYLINGFELLALAVITACAVFLVRRNVLKLRRFISHDLDGWPRSDANYILITEIILMSLFLLMNAADGALQLQQVAHYAQHKTGPFIISNFITPYFQNWQPTAIMVIERLAWWLHIAGILVFLNFLPYSKHLHILFAFPNAWYARQSNKGKMDNMPFIQKEVALAMGQDIANNPTLLALPQEPPAQFGAKDFMDLSWKNLLDAFSCTECGRCSVACPANSTGKLLSPRNIMMKTRDRAEEASRIIVANNKQWADDGKSLLHNYITIEELRACTTCNACVEECPVSISPLDIIIKLRRHLILDESNSPGEWNTMFGNIENNFAPWKFNPEERTAWLNS